MVSEFALSYALYMYCLGLEEMELNLVYEGVELCHI